MVESSITYWFFLFRTRSSKTRSHTPERAQHMNCMCTLLAKGAGAVLDTTAKHGRAQFFAFSEARNRKRNSRYLGAIPYGFPRQATGIARVA